MRPLWMVLGLLIMLAGAQAAEAVNAVDIRFVRAHQQGGVSSGLGDVADMLRSNLPYSGFALLSRSNVGLPSGGQTTGLAKGYSIRCSGGADRLSVQVKRGDAQVLNVAVTLREGVPVILGGFPDGSDRLLLVLKAR